MADHVRTTPARWASVVTTITCLTLLAIASGMSTSPRSWAPTSLPAEYREVSVSVSCGAMPQSGDEFLALRRVGIRTIVSVDGSTPDLVTAADCRLRYVHIPIGYDGIPQDAVARLTRVVQECELPVYIHCHHGKHRGPAAAAVCAMIAGEIDTQHALTLLTDAGTSSDYASLWRDVQVFSRLAEDAPLPELAAFADVEPLTQLMVRIDECFADLGDAIRSSQFTTAHEHTSVLFELFRESGRLHADEAANSWLPDMRDAESAAAALRDDLHDLSPGDRMSRYQQLAQACHSCHQAHRN